MRTVYLGTSQFAAGVLERLAGGPHRPALVVTRPDRPQGRGRRTQSTPVADRARALGLDLIAPEKLHEPEVIARIEAAEPDVLVVCAYGVLVKEPLLSLREILNVHPSLLPRWRGAAPVERAIMAGDEETGVSIMRLTAGLDSGPVCLQAAEPIHADDDYASLAARLERLGGDLLVRALDERPPFAEQEEAGVTYAEKLGPADRTLDPAKPPEVLERAVRALRPHVGTRVGLPGGEFLGVRAARVAERDGARAAPAGGRVHAEEGRLLLDARGGALELLEVQPAGGKPMPAAAWLRGRTPVPYRLDPRRPGEPVADLARAAVAEWDPEAAWAPYAEALARRRGGEVVETLRGLAGEARPAARALAATVLGQVGAPAPAAGDVHAAAAILDGMARTEVAHDVLAAVVCALGHLGPEHGTEALLALHRHPDAEVRDAVAFALLGRDDERAREALRALAADPDPRIRAWAEL